MKRALIFLVLALNVALAAAATLSPIQLLNPVGSSVGQAIVSTGPSTPPSWGTASLPAVSSNALVGNIAGAPAVPIGVSVPSCSAANGALKWTTNAGFSCGTAFALTSGNLSQFASTTSAQLATVLSDETGTGTSVFSTSPTLTTPTIAGAALSGTFSGTPTFSGAVAFSSSITPSQTAGIVGTTTSNNANAGSIGEFVNAQGTGVSLTSGINTNIASISLTAGDWDVKGNIEFVPAGGASLTAMVSSVNSTSATMQSAPARGVLQFSTPTIQTVAAPMLRFSLAATTTIYLVGQASWTGGTATATGYVSARRVR